MSYGYGQAFEADPAQVRAVRQATPQIAEEARAIASDFSAAVERTSTWTGSGDNYADEARPQAKRERDFMAESLAAVADAIDATIAAHFRHEQTINSASGYALDSVDQLRSEMDEGNDFYGGSGKS